MALAPRIDSIQAGQNLAINGNFDFFQRGVGPISISNAAVGRLADRFNFRPSATNGTGSMARSTVVPTLVQSGFQSTYSLQVTAPASGGASSANTTTSVDTRLEGYDYAPIHGKPTRISFWVRSSVTGTYYMAFCNSDHSREYLVPYTITAANTLEKKTIDIPAMDTSGTWLFDNGIGLAAHWILQAGSSRQSGTVGSWFTKAADGAPIAGPGGVDFWGTANATFYLSQVMIIQGSFDANVDFPFKRAGRTIADELAMCQRYYEKSYDIGVTPATSNGSGIIIANIAPGVDSYVGIFYKVPKRAATHTLTIYNPSTNAASNLIVYKNGGGQVNTAVTGTATQDHQAYLGFAGNAAGDRNYTQFHWVAEAEL